MYSYNLFLGAFSKFGFDSVKLCLMNRVFKRDIEDSKYFFLINLSIGNFVRFETR